MKNRETLNWRYFAAYFLLSCAVSAVVNHYFVRLPFPEEPNVLLNMVQTTGFYVTLFTIYFAPFGLASFLLAFFTKRKHLIPLYMTYALLPAVLVSMFFTYQIWKQQAGFGAN